VSLIPGRLRRYAFLIPASFLLGHVPVLSARLPADTAVTLTVRPGQSPAEVRDRLGPPVRITRQILFRHYVEQWVYDVPQAVRVEFRCSRGRDPYVAAVLPTPPLRP
jgi:hypothetical protein